MTTTEGFEALFTGRRDAFGTGRGEVIKRALTTQDYANHLDGIGPGLGVFPLRDDDTVRFGAIDLDEPDFQMAAAMARLIPGQTFIERSRSGNAHVWVFFRHDAPAWVVKGILRKATMAVDMPHVEVFPKQERIRPPARFGNYINLPYHGDTRPVLALSAHRFFTMGHPGGEGVSLPEFVSLAMETRQIPAEWIERAKYLGLRAPEERVDDGTPFGQSPVLHECALYIIENRETNPIRPGHRNVVLFNLSVQLLNYRDMTDREAWELVNLVNDASVEPVPESDLQDIFDRAHGGYRRTGCDDPLMEPYVHPNCPIKNGQLGR